MPAVRLRLEESPRYKDVGASVTPFRLSTAAFWLPVTSASVAPSPSHLDRSDEVRGVLSPFPKDVVGYGPSGRIASRIYPNQLVPLFLMTGLQAINSTPLAGNGTNEVQTLTQSGTWTGGTFTLTFGGVTSDPIPWNATAALCQAILENMANVEPGDIVVSGGPLPGVALTFTFQGQYAATNVAALTGTFTNLTGTTPGGTFATTTAGATGTTLLPNGSGLTAGAYMWQFGPLTGNVPRTATMELSYDAPWTYGAGLAGTSLGFGNDGGLSMDMVGLDVGRYLVDPALSPSYDAETVRPLLPKDMVAAWASGSAPVSALSWTLSNGVETRMDQGRRTQGYPGRTYLTGYPTVAGSLDSSEFDPDDWDNLINATQFSVTQTWRSPSKIATTGCSYQLWLECPAVQIVDGGPEDLQAKRMHGATWNWEAKHANASGYSFRITLACATASAEVF